MITLFFSQRGFKATAYFQQEGLDTDIRVLSAANVALKTMLEDGTLDMVSVAQTPVVFHSFVRNDYAIIAAMADSDNSHKLLARKDRGIYTPNDLKGKAIGVTKGASGQFFLDVFLLSHSINLAEVEIIDLAAGALAQALVEGRVDAIATWEPHVRCIRSVIESSTSVNIVHQEY